MGMRSDSHEDEISNVPLYALYHLGDSVEVASFGIRVTRHDNYHFIIIAAFGKLEIAGCKSIAGKVSLRSGSVTTDTVSPN